MRSSTINLRKSDKSSRTVRRAEVAQRLGGIEFFENQTLPSIAPFGIPEKAGFVTGLLTSLSLSLDERK
jgi:hypothetical protein